MARTIYKFNVFHIKEVKSWAEQGWCGNPAVTSAPLSLSFCFTAVNMWSPAFLAIPHDLMWLLEFSPSRLSFRPTWRGRRKISIPFLSRKVFKSLTSSTRILYRTWSHCHTELLGKLQIWVSSWVSCQFPITTRFLIEKKGPMHSLQRRLECLSFPPHFPVQRRLFLLCLPNTWYVSHVCEKYMYPNVCVPHHRKPL